MAIAHVEKGLLSAGVNIGGGRVHSTPNAPRYAPFVVVVGCGTGALTWGVGPLLSGDIGCDPHDGLSREPVGGRSGIRTLEYLAALPVFLATIAFATEMKLVCGLDFAFTLTVVALGGSRQVSTRS